MIVASPWSRGGWVNSQLFEHTSVNQFLEHFLNEKTGRSVRENNISSWRRAISGNLTTVFRPFDGTSPESPFVQRDPFVETIYKSKFQPPPSDFRQLGSSEIAAAQQGKLSSLMGTQEPGTRPSCALPYELYAEATLNSTHGNATHVALECKAGNDVFGKDSIGSPFNVYLRGLKSGVLRNVSYAVAAGETVRDSWPLDAFVDGKYHIEVYGPNGFFREFQGEAKTPVSSLLCPYEMTSGRPTGNIVLHLSGGDDQPIAIEIEDCAYGAAPVRKTTRRREKVVWNLQSSSGWYDVRVGIRGRAYSVARYAGHVETGRPSISDPFMGGITA